MPSFEDIKKAFGQTSSDKMGQAVEEMVTQALLRRRSHERRWFDNNFFDDGYHFRAVSPKTGKVIDHANKTTGYVERAIPRASRQIRGVANLLFAAEPYPVVYPERISMSEFMINGNYDEKGYNDAKEQAKHVARKQGVWLANEWADEQQLVTKLLDMIIIAAKNSVSYIQVSSDTHKQKILTDVYDGFELILFGEKRELQSVPFITKTTPMDVEEAQNSPLFDPAKAKNLTPDNKYATSEIKDAYMRNRFGVKSSDKQPTIIIKETFIKEYLSEDNWENAVKLSEGNGAMEGKSKGDQIMRHIYSGAGVTLSDEYIDYDDYPFADFRFEPGPLYQVPFIERFIPQNKSLDIIMTRMEKWVNTMVVGTYMTRKGENFQLSNFPGGNKIEYEAAAPAQMNIASPTNAPFQVLEMLGKFIDEQGAATSSLNQLPTGVKSGVAIESLKSTEYANLKIPTLMLKKTIKSIAELMLERADKDFLEPVEVSDMQDGEPQYFDVIGSRGMKLSQQVNKPLPEGTIPLKKDLKVRIEIEAGLGLTQEGKKESSQQLIDYYLKLYEAGFVSPEAMTMIVKRFTETLGYGSTEELMEAIEDGITQGQMSDQQMQQLKVAVLEVMKEAGVVGPEADQKLVDASKIGTLETLHQTGLVKNEKQAEQQQKVLDDMTKIYKDAPIDIRKQIEEALGMQPSVTESTSPVEADTAVKIHTASQPNNQPGNMAK